MIFLTTGRLLKRPKMTSLERKTTVIVCRGVELVDWASVFQKEFHTLIKRRKFERSPRWMFHLATSSLAPEQMAAETISLKVNSL